MIPFRLTAAFLVLGALARPIAAFADSPGAGGDRKVDMVSGAETYRHICQACHMADAKGAVGAATIPALAGNKKLAVSAYPVMIVLNGYGAMPWFNGVLSPQQIADVVNYVRTHFGNSYADPVTVDMVKAMAGPAPHPMH